MNNTEQLNAPLGERRTTFKIRLSAWHRLSASTARRDETDALVQADVRSGAHARNGRLRARVVHSTFAVIRAAALILSAVCCSTDIRAQTSADHALAPGEARFHFDPADEAVVVPVDFNGRRRLFCVDTGAGLSAFDISFLDELSPPLRTIGLQTSDGGGNKTHVFRAPAVSVGGLHVVGLSEVLCFDLWRLRAASGIELYGCLGLDFLRQYVVRFDFDRGEIAFLNSVPEDSGTPLVLHMRARGRPPMVMVSLPGVGKQPFLIDSGFNGNGHIEGRLIQTLIDMRNATVVDAAGIETVAKSGVRREVRVRGEICLDRFRHGDLLFSEAAENFLGLGYLRRYIATFDFPGKKLYLKPGARYSRQGRGVPSGTALWRPNGVTTVHYVLAASSADRAGLKEGDVVEEVDLQLASSLALRRLHVMLSTPGEHILRVRRGGQSLRIVLLLPERESRPDSEPPAGTIAKDPATGITVEKKRGSDSDSNGGERRPSNNRGSEGE